MSCLARGGLRTGEKVGGCKKRVHFSDESPVTLAPEYDGIGAANATTTAKSYRFAGTGPGLVEVFAKASITCDVNFCTAAGLRQLEADAGEKLCDSEGGKSSLAKVLEKTPNSSSNGIVTEFSMGNSPTTPPSCGNHNALALWDINKSNHSMSHVRGAQRKLTFAVGAGDQRSRKHGHTSKRAQNYKVVPESEGSFPTDFTTPHLNVMHTFRFTNGAACKKRCAWITPHSDAVYVAYHDEEWGVPVHDDRRLFELLVFAGAQSEIAWSSILTKREAYRDAFAQFDPVVLATYDTTKVAAMKPQRDLMKSEARLQSIVNNAKVVMKILEEFGSFNEYLWRFVSYKPIVSNYKQAKSIPMRTAKSEVISKDLQRRGMRHTGPMVIHSFMQAAGLANDHLVSCFCHSSSSSSSPPSSSPLSSRPSTKPLIPPLCC